MANKNMDTIDNLLDRLEDSLNTPVAKQNTYKEIQQYLCSNTNISLDHLQKLLSICTHDLKNDMSFTTHAITIKSDILSKIKTEPHESKIDLVPSAIAILNLMDTLIQEEKYTALEEMCFGVLILYPDDTLIELATKNRTIVMNMILNYGFTKNERKLAVFKFIHKVLTILPVNKREAFMKNGLAVWFSHIVPEIVTQLCNTSTPDSGLYLEVLEVLADSLVNVDYAENHHWKTILMNIYTVDKYPSVMKSMLEAGNDNWHRLWIVFIKLLKNQITKVNNSTGSPINAMLPVVEVAFKMDTANRCRAFQCWKVLIDNFSSELNEAYVNKRIKLLIIPLRANNAKVEEVALAKLDAWWHLIRKFHTKIDKFTDFVVLPFLHFCFGKPLSGKPMAPGQMSFKIKRQCVQSLVEIAGHVNCKGCVTIPRLSSKLITVKLLANHWNDWIHCLSSAIEILAQSEDESATQQATCLWKAIVMTIADLPENNIRKDLFNSVLAVIELFLKDTKTNVYYDLIFNVLICSLFTEQSITKLLKVKDEEKKKEPLNIVLTCLLKTTRKHFYKSEDTKALIEKLKPITTFLIEEAPSYPDQIVERLLTDMTPNDNTLMIWSALVESLSESKYDMSAPRLCNMLLWPLKSSHVFSHGRSALIWYNWHTLYNLVHPKLRKKIDSQIFTILSAQSDNASANILQLSAAVAVLKHKLNEDSADFVKEADILLKVLHSVKEYEHLSQGIPILTDVLVLMLNVITESVNLTHAEKTLKIFMAALVMTTKVLKLENSVPLNDNLTLLIDNVCNPLQAMLKKEQYSALKEEMSGDLINIFNCLKENVPLKKNLISILKIVLSTIKMTDVLYKRIIATIDTIDIKSESHVEATTKEEPVNNFPVPEVKVTKKSKKKEPSIVNTVVENGEEYVVVKSNWKFNPRKLTENQKEKLKRKREDIPALYQDLSQSQDEFKLTTWKTDSQDASSTSSRSTSKSANEDVSTMLKNIPSSNVVPTIIENMLSENVNNDNQSSNKAAEDSSKKNASPATKDSKTPRLALKDRVFRSTSKSANEDDSTMLTNIQSSNVVPTIIENMSENVNSDKQSPTKAAGDFMKNNASPATKDPKTPRLALKDRVFRNVRNLIEKSGKQSEGKLINEDLNQTVMDISMKTPSTKAINSLNLVNSAPSKINTERPSRVIKKPKKFDDTEVFSIKKRRKSQTDSQPVTEPQMPFEETDVQMAAITDDKKPVNEPPKPTNIVTQEAGITQKTVTNICVNDIIDLVENTETSQPLENIRDKINAISENEKCDIGKEDIKSTDSIKYQCSDSPLDGETPKQTKNNETTETKSSAKKKRSRIEKQLLIDMVEGHPFLQVQSEKRVTRKNLASPVNTPKRTSLAEKLNKAKSDVNSASKTDKKTKEKDVNDKGTKENDTKEKPSPITKSTETVISLESRISESSDDLPMSEDIIESSQDSTITTISVKSTKSGLKKVPVVILDRKSNLSSDSHINNTQSLLKEFNDDVMPLNDSLPPNQENRDDIELPENRTVVDDKTELDLTENMDTEPLEPKDNSSDVIVISNDVLSPVIINTESTETVSDETQELADADTQPMDVDNQSIDSAISKKGNSSGTHQKSALNDVSVITIDTQEDATKTIDFSATENADSTNICSPFKDDVKRRKDFLNDTIEISPIKTLSPVRENKSPSPETSSDYVVIKLASAVQSNGEPYENCDSPEIFTEDNKVSPDKRDQSPPREEVVVNNTSPSSSLSLKKNRPQVRSTCRGAQMLSLCAPDKLEAIMNSERSVESDEPKKSQSTPARRNLRILYSSVGDNSEKSDESDNNENFLKFKKALPTADCSPSGPILKRKLIDIADEATISPASKRKRVSFHDPPVSTTIAVQKYIEPGLVRSPQSSANKRQEKQLRSHANMKSPKRLDTAFKLDTILIKAVESFSGDTSTISDDMTLSSLDQTPAVEIIKTSDLNDSDPICPELLDCNDPIDNIAGELSSPAMKSLLIKELTGKVETIADLAKMTELEVNRLCIKAPKVKVAKKVLFEYASNRATNTQEQNNRLAEPSLDINVTEPVNHKVSIEVQTNQVVSVHNEMQTVDVEMSAVYTQTVRLLTADCSAQTTETGVKSTKDLITSCLKDRPDFIDGLSEQLEESSIERIADKLPFNASADLLIKKMSTTNATEILNRILEKYCNIDTTNGTMDTTFFQDYLCNRLESKDLILFCSQLLMKLHNKPA